MDGSRLPGTGPRNREKTMGATLLFRYLLSLLLGLTLAGRAVAADLHAQLDRSRVAEGDTLTLLLSAPGDAQGSPDLTPLEKDFDVLGQTQSSRVSIVNGRSSSSRDWRLTLAPKRSGRLQVPVIHLGSLSSAPLQVEVVPASQADRSGAGRAVMVEAEVEPKTPYVQGQSVYTVRVLYRVPLQQASLSDPKAGDAVLEQLGKDRSFSTRRGGQRYNVIERRYALFPQHSGQLHIDAPVLSASVPEARRGSRRGGPFGGDPFGDFERILGSDPFGDMGSLFQRTRPIQVRGPGLSLDVKPQPPGSASPWLPAESVQLSETWSPDPPVARVGEPLTRTLAITAQGVTAAQIPDLQPAVPDGVKVYPDKAQTDTHADGDHLVAMKVLKEALVPSRPGRLTLPEVRLAWWDTGSSQQRVAVLPARTLDVKPAPAGAAPPPAPAPTSAPAAPSPKTAPPRTQSPAPAHGLSPAAVSAPVGAFAAYWPWITGMLALAWMATLGLWLRERRRGRARALGAESARPAPVDGIARARSRVQRACRANDPRAAREALLAWGVARWPEDPPRRLDTLARRLGPPAAGLLAELDRRLYAGEQGSWDGAAAWSGLGPALQTPQRAPKAATTPLPALYPQST